MKLLAIAALTRAHADAFELRNLEGFETCMQLDEMLVTEMTADGSQYRWLSDTHPFSFVIVRTIRSTLV
jgi:hypothetical protein